MQAITFALAVWLLAGAVYINLRIRHEMAGPLKDLYAALALNEEINAAQAEFMEAAAGPYFKEDSSAEFQSAARRLQASTERYFKLSLSPEERQALESLQQIEQRLVERANHDPESSQKKPERARGFGEIRTLNRQIDTVQHNMLQAQLDRLGATTAQVHEYTRWLYLLFAAFGLFVVLVLVQFRRLHRQEIWGPLEDLRGMVMEIQRGNLDVAAGVPGSLEFGALVKGFLAMAGTLREMRDSLEQKVRERTAKLETTQRELAQAAKLSSLGQLVSGVAHEINNPLTSILGFSELALARPELDAQLRAQLQTIREEAIRLRTLVANLNAFARRGPHHTTRLDLRALLDRLAELRRYQLGANNITLHYDRPAKPVWVEGDPDRLLQVFFNLVLNAEQAIQSCRTRGDVWLACGVEDGRAWATVRDNGAGMSPEVKEHIFDPFYTTKSVGQGTGLGLSISHGIIQQHHGAISVESVEGQGTILRATLPAAEQPAASASAPLSNPDASVQARRAGDASGPRVLIIDDEPSITQLLAQFLEDLGWSYVVLNDSMAVESSLANHRFDVVICDLKMPGKNGLEVLRLLRQEQPELARRFLLMTGNLAEAAQEYSAELAGVPILRKPFNLARLAEALRALLPTQY